MTLDIDMLGPMKDTQHNKYLGLPSIVGKSKVEIFAKIKEKGKNYRVERKNTLNWWLRDPYQSCRPSNSNLHYELLPDPKKSL